MGVFRPSASFFAHAVTSRTYLAYVRRKARIDDAWLSMRRGPSMTGKFTCWMTRLMVKEVFDPQKNCSDHCGFLRGRKSEVRNISFIGERGGGLTSTDENLIRLMPS